jgi:hypothetical protein
MGYSLRTRCFACSDAKKHRQAAHVSRSAVGASSQALPLLEQPPGTPPGAATFPSEEHGAASAAADLAPQLAAAQAQLREQRPAISALQDKYAENTAQLASALVELHELRRQCAPPPTSLAPVEPRPTSDDMFFPASPAASTPPRSARHAPLIAWRRHPPRSARHAPLIAWRHHPRSARHAPLIAWRHPPRSARHAPLIAWRHHPRSARL